MKITIASDLVPTVNDIDNFITADFDSILDKKLLNIWSNADYRIFNLECVLGDNQKLNKISKAGPNLIAPKECINGINKLNPSLVLLANNHILDYGKAGLINTMNILSENSIKYTGIIDNNVCELDNTFLEKDGIRVGIYNLCENEFSVATNDCIGANGLNEIKNYREIKKLKDNSDHVIVVFHGGKEFYRYPSINLQRLCHNFVDFGADYVVVQHSHCIGCEEEYNGKKIVYGQGNFIFNSKNDEYWNSSMLLNLEITKDKIDTKYLFYEKDENKYLCDTSNKYYEEYKHRSNQIKTKGFVEENYNKFSLDNLNLYLMIMSRVTFFNRIRNRIFKRKYYIKKYSKKDLLSILNIVECEAHRELLINGLKYYICQK